MATFKQLKKAKENHCKGKKGSYAKMRSICKDLVQQAKDKAPRGEKTITAKATRAEAMAIVKGACKLSKK